MDGWMNEDGWMWMNVWIDDGWMKGGMDGPTYGVPHPI